MGRVYFPDAHTPEEWKEKARECHRKEAESFERSDTDGFLSQWAMSVSAQLYSTLADVAERGGTWEFEMLADAAGNVIEEAKHVKTRYGYAWLLPGGIWFNPSQARDDEKRKAANLKKGFQLVTVEREAVVTMAEGGSWSVYPVVLPKRSK